MKRVALKTGRVMAVAAMIGCLAATELTVARLAIGFSAVAWLVLSMAADEFF